MKQLNEQEVVLLAAYLRESEANADAGIDPSLDPEIAERVREFSQAAVPGPNARFSARLRAQILGAASARAGRKRRLRLLTTRWGVAVAAGTVALIAGLGVIPAILAPSHVSAAAVLASIQDEALGTAGNALYIGAQVTGAQGAAGGNVVVVGFQSQAPGTSGPAVVATDGSLPCPPAGPPSLHGPVAVGPGESTNPNQLSDRLGQALGVSGASVRDAMAKAILVEMPAPPLPLASGGDPATRIAQQLGVDPQKVRDAFGNPQCP